ncbi:isochorismatase family protein [Pseudoruegeria sp. HB172150]|uniref:isochorismatase family protein n=1 Tax=Pseudoruegeria sp. HB172150 TaxID=2721164 RepID=UPI001C12F12D|nr:isochorismatase family protein [Pseudoruegeria sp. HB172150]
MLIDLQEEHRRDIRYLVEGYDRVLDNSARLLASARGSGVPVLHAAYERDFGRVPLRLHEPVGDSGVPLFSVPGDPITAICPEVAPEKDEYVLRKNDMSCFCEPEFEGKLRETGADWLVVAGVWTEACVAATVRDAMAHGFRVVLVKDACGSGTIAMHQTAMMHMANRLYGGAVAATEGALALLTGETRHVWQLVGSTPLRFEAETIESVYDAI